MVAFAALQTERVTLSTPDPAVRLDIDRVTLLKEVDGPLLNFEATPDSLKQRDFKLEHYVAELEVTALHDADGERDFDAEIAKLDAMEQALGLGEAKKSDSKLVDFLKKYRPRHARTLGYATDETTG